MKKVHCLFVAIIAIMTLDCCKESRNKNSLLIDDEKYSSVLLEDFADSIRVVRIYSSEPMDEIGYGTKYYDNNLLFLGSIDNKTIYCLRNDSVISKLNAVGRGPGEYITLTQICYSAMDSLLYGYESGKLAIMCYRVPSFEFVKSIKVNTSITAMRYVGDNTILAVGRTPSMDSARINGVFEISTVTNEINKIMPLEYLNAYLFGNSSFFPHDGKQCLIVPGFDNRVYEYSDHKLRELISFNYGKRNLSGDLFKTDESQLESYMSMMSVLLSGYYSVGGFYAIMRDSNLMFWHNARFEDKKYTLATICDGMKYKNYLFTIPGIKEDVFPDFVQKDWYAIVFEGSKESVLDENKPLSPLGRKIIEAVDSQTDDNPVLLYFKIPL
ncbi:MAG: 6-bladed beta-propeller [Bacteroidaceae bacterium]|jgi:hypothetical protein